MFSVRRIGKHRTEVTEATVDGGHGEDKGPDVRQLAVDLSVPPDNRQLTLTTARRPPDGSGWGKGFLDNLVGDQESLTDELELAREPMMLNPFEPGGGRVGFFEHETHFRGDLEAASGGSDGAVFRGGRRDAANELGGDHPGSKFRHKIVDPIEQNAQEPCGRINIHITIGYNVILFCMNVKCGNLSTFGVWRRRCEARRFPALTTSAARPFLAGI
jgi:hypothetical protein